MGGRESGQTIGFSSAHSLLRNIEMSTRSEVLSLYGRIFRVARHWKSASETSVAMEQCYIRDEARRLFKKNKNVLIQ